MTHDPRRTPLRPGDSPKPPASDSHSRRQTYSAVVLAAGESRRFWPLATNQHKSLFKLGGISLLERTIRSLAAVGIPDIILVESPRSQFEKPDEAILPSDVFPADYEGCSLRFVQQPTAAGQGDAILRCAELLGESFFVVQPENVNAGDIALELIGARRAGDIAVVPGQERADFSLYAVLEHVDGRLNRIVEKPSTSADPQPLCNMGVYLFGHEFIDCLSTIAADPLNIIYAIDNVARSGRAAVVRSRHEFLPLKFPGHLWAYDRMLGRVPQGAAEWSPLTTAGRCLVSEGCTLGDVRLDNVIIGPNSTIGSGTETVNRAVWDDLDAVIIGPEVTIGEDVRLLPRVRIGQRATIGAGVRVDTDVPDGATVP